MMAMLAARSTHCFLAIVMLAAAMPFVEGACCSTYVIGLQGSEPTYTGKHLMPCLKKNHCPPSPGPLPVAAR